MIHVDEGALRDAAGDLVQEVRQVWTDWCNVTLRVRRGAPTFELIVTAGPLPWSRPAGDGRTNGTELVVHMTSDIASNGSLWTDANGREM